MLNKKTSKMIYNINYIFTIMIIYMHVTNIKIYDYSNNLLGKIFYQFQIIMADDILAVCVPGFFIISGYLFYYNLHEENLIPKMKKRIDTLVKPYILWNIISLLYFFVLSNVLTNYINMANVDLSIRNILEGIFLFKYSPVNWFVFQLIIYVAIAPLLYYIFKNKNIARLFILILGTFLLLNFNYGIFSIESFSPCLRIDSLFFYCIGIYISKYNDIFLKLNKISGYKNIFITFLVSQLFIFINSIVHFNLFFIGIIILFFAFVMFCYQINLGTITKLFTPFFVFQIHEFILEPIEKVFLIIFGTNPIYGFFDYLVSPLLCIFIIVIISLFMNKKCPKLYQNLVGGR